MPHNTFFDDDALAQWALSVCTSQELSERLNGEQEMQETRLAIERSVLWQSEWGIFWSVFTEALRAQIIWDGQRSYHGFFVSE